MKFGGLKDKIRAKIFLISIVIAIASTIASVSIIIASATSSLLTVGSSVTNSKLIIGSSVSSSRLIIINSASVDAPAINVLAASNIAKYSAQLNALVVDDGGEGSVQVRFGYGASSQATFSNYTVITAWQIGKHIGDHVYFITPANLSIGTTYYFRVQALNSNSTVTSSELSFITSTTLGNVTNFIANPSSTSVTLTWIRASGSSRTLIKQKVGGFPSSTEDGTTAYLGTGSQTTVTSLTAGTVYYFAAWGYDDALHSYSSTPSEVVISTQATGQEQNEFPVPTLPDTFFQTPAPTGAAKFEPFYSTFNDFVADWGMPAENGWLGIWLIGTAIASIIVYIKIKEIFIGLGVAEFLLVIGMVMIGVPGWILVIPVFIGLGIWGIERYFQ